MTEVQLAILRAIQEKEELLQLPGASISDWELDEKLGQMYPDVRGEAFALSNAEPEETRLVSRHDACFMWYALTPAGRSAMPGNA